MVDGDKLLVVADKLLCRIAKRNMKNIVPLYYDMKKAPNQYINNEILFNGLISAYKGGNIGPYSNNIAKIWNGDKVEKEQIDVIKLLCMENNFVIDMAKTLYVPTRPKDKDKLIKQYTKLKLPHFFIYAKDKKSEQVDKVNNSPMNMLEGLIGHGRLAINKTINKINFKVLLSDMEWKPNEEDVNYIVQQYDYWNRCKNNIIRFKDKDKRNENEAYVYTKVRQELIDLGFDMDYLVNSLVWFLYNKRNSSDKKTLWECFGKEILSNIKRNVESTSLICPICGKRFNPISNNQICCNTECGKILNREKQRERNNK